MKETRDILVLFEALNNHEIFTPPRLAKEMLELLPDEVWTDPNLKFLDPCTKSGIFLREIFYRLYEGIKGKGIHKACDGLNYDLNNDQERINHILKNMIYGVATSELTGYIARRTLYGVMEANTDKQIAALDSFAKSENYHQWSEEEQLKFVGRNRFNEYYDYKMFNTVEHKGFEEEGNIFYPSEEVAKKILEDGNYEIEDTYYPFINDETRHRKILDIKEGKMKFDVIIGNPPYQISDGGGRDSSAKPIYHHFIQMAKKISPKYFSFIIPARWYSGGKGLDSFREEMISDKRIMELHDFPETDICFPGVNIRGGVCYFLWSSKHNESCKVLNYSKSEKTDIRSRFLKEDNSSVLIRQNKAIDVLEKVLKVDSSFYSEKVSSRKPFGLESSNKGNNLKTKSSVVMYRVKEKTFIERDEIKKNIELVDKIKVIVSKASPGGDEYPHKIISTPLIADKGSCCTETYLVVDILDSHKEAENLIEYMETKFFRFMMSLVKNTQNISKGVFAYVPILDLRKKWTDESLINRYGLTKEDVLFINSMIKPMR